MILEFYHRVNTVTMLRYPPGIGMYHVKTYRLKV